MNNFINKGLIISLVTPLDNFDRLDFPALEKLINHVIDGGVAGISILGQTGEEHCLDYRLRTQLISEVTQIVNMRVPVYVSISDVSFMECYNIANFAASCGASAIILAPPYYYSAGQPELLEYYEQISKIVSIPIIVYNSCHNNSKLSLEPSTVAKLSEIDNIIGLKDNTANSVYLNTILSMSGDMKKKLNLYVANEEIIGQSVIMGADSGMSGGASIYPKLYVALYKAAAEKNMEEYMKLQSIVMKISRELYSIGKYHSSYVKGIKCALSIKGIINDDYMAPPFHKFNAPEREKVAKALEEIENMIPNEYL